VGAVLRDVLRDVPHGAVVVLHVFVVLQVLN
jgi:hypothetical protein